MILEYGAVTLYGASFQSLFLTILYFFSKSLKLNDFLNRRLVWET